MRKIALFACMALTLWAAIHGPAPRLDSWRIVGPGGAGGMFLPTISPHDSNLVLELCDMTGSYVSLDAGRSWRMFNLRGRVSAFAFDPRDAKVIYAGNHALWRSEDTGKTWRMVFPDPARNIVEHMRDDHAAVVLQTDDPIYPSGARVRWIAVDPADSRKLYVALRARGGTVLLASRDRGKSWTREAEHDQQVQLVYAGGGVRVLGADVQSATAGHSRIYVTKAAGMQISDDSGATWRNLDNAVPGAARYGPIACSALHPETAYVGFVREDRSFGIARTTDSGGHWNVVYDQARGRWASNLERAWIEEFYGGAGPVLELGVAPSNPGVCYATDGCPRSFRTLDGGRTWQQVISERVDPQRWTTTGFDVTTCYGVHFDPFEPRTMFISYTDVGLFKSEDRGATWKSAIAGIPRPWRNTTYWVAFDPEVKGRMWGAFARTHDLPRDKMWRRADPDTFQGGVGTSTDGGEHWTVTNAGMPETAVTHILLDPASPANARVLYACGFGRGVYKSSDGGANWALKIQGIEDRQPFAWRIARTRAGTLYLLMARRSEAESGALYRSTDGAEHWVRMKLPEGVTFPAGLALDPTDNRRMYLGAWDGGVFLSTDAGAAWKNIFRAAQHVYDVTVDERDPRVIYNTGFESAAYRSTDRGATWTRIRGFNFKWGHRVIPDPVDRGKIYITTFGGSVWHGPAAGDPRAMEDIIR